ncbi:uncharacterized protein METZ01_LOCUS412438, partial [marine metagenome]
VGALPQTQVWVAARGLAPHPPNQYVPQNKARAPTHGQPLVLGVAKIL